MLPLLLLALSCLVSDVSAATNAASAIVKAYENDTVLLPCHVEDLGEISLIIYLFIYLYLITLLFIFIGLLIFITTTSSQTNKHSLINNRFIIKP